MKLRAIVILSVLAVITVGAGVVQVNKATPQVTEPISTTEKASSSEAETTSASGAAALHTQAAVASQEQKQPVAPAATATQPAAATSHKTTTKEKVGGTSKVKPTPAAKDNPEPAHTHEWEPVYETVTYDEVSSSVREICKGCGADITNWSTAKWNAHSDAHLAAGEPAGFVEKEIKITTPKTIQKKVGYKCSCGATK